MPNLTFDLAYWINERENIRIRREQGIPAPWTTNRVMATTRWCNVHREDDKVTKWMDTHWRGVDKPLWWSVLGRMVNYIPSLEALLTVTTPEEAATVLKARRAAKHKIWTSAYTISTCGKVMDKVDYVCNHVIATVREVPPKVDTTLADAYVALQQIDGIGSFLAGQVIADLKNTPGHPLQTAPDWQAWACPGPGSLRGLNWYFGGAKGAGITARNFKESIEVAYDEVLPFITNSVLPMHMQDFQNCLCEFSKYMKLSNGGGHARNSYLAG